MVSSQGGDCSFSIFSALSVNGGELTNKNLKGVGEIHQGKKGKGKREKGEGRRER